MNAEEFRANLIALRTKLDTAMPSILLSVVVDTTSQVRNRSIENGIFVDGLEGAKADYSTTEIPTYFFRAKVRNQGGRNYLKNNPLGTWHEFRKAQGLQSESVNLSYTGRFWASLQPGSLVRLGRVLSVEVTVGDGQVQQYADYLVDRYGEFYQPTLAEEGESRNVMKDELERALRAYL